YQADDSKVRKNAMLIAEAGALTLDGEQAAAGINDADDRVRLPTLRALAASPMTPEASTALLAAAPGFRDPWSRAAAAAAGSSDAGSQLETILADEGDSGQSEDAVRSLAASLAADGGPAQLLGVLRAAAASPHPALA